MAATAHDLRRMQNGHVVNGSLAYDLDWDVTNDEPIDEETANAILESNRKHYTALEYFPYIFY